MTDKLTTAVLAAILGMAGSAVAQAADSGDIERYLDRKGDRIDHRLDRKGDRVDYRLDRKGDRIDRHLDRKGQQFKHHAAVRHAR